MSDDATSFRDPRWRDAALGALFIAVGILAFVGARELVGWSGSVAGPGTMPMVLSIALVVLGAIVAIGGVIRPRPTVPASLGPLVWVLAAATAFGLALPALGLVCAAVLAAAIAMRGVDSGAAKDRRRAQCSSGNIAVPTRITANRTLTMRDRAGSRRRPANDAPASSHET
jgi:Tripartite tricarboxylate transporter TctB family